ncbi:MULTISPECIES: hypothetical protein [Mycobacteroides]|uniref:hypothetical protein n=1 Tax=Mycobacteroides TaxID=670516 RepID=UPI00092A3B48|nr:hypothetical protein [Mycobacteroides abscessus]NGX06468.1 hypothetical protein [Mycobacteroides franklinii]SHT27614.1 Uncharacterised protein [Mycobacteroides abscessus subsp. abscessus]SHW70628.1 Uncharacterised protein [Mycobacteroides abscessus subsp. abscessus]SHY73167.1 Uncharacterised protein [Mycobacteroides abscessus subsp. abscessus]SHZ41291.1 Uncharacterised protein [Mycobacteroides abscessus subsp. abscessus]
MSPRVFIGIVGAILLGVGISLAWYETSATAAGRTIECGTIRHPDTPGAWAAQTKSRQSDPTPTDYNALCAEKRETVKFFMFGLAVIGALTIVGAVFIRKAVPVNIE